MAHKALKYPRFMTAGASRCRRCDTFFVGSAKKHCDQPWLVQQTRPAELPDEVPIIVVIGGNGTRRQRCPERVSNVANEAVEHGGHQGPLLLGQALGRIEKEVDANRGQPVAPRGARGRVLVGHRSSDRPFFRHHRGRLIEFLLTSRQLGA